MMLTLRLLAYQALRYRAEGPLRRYRMLHTVRMEFLVGTRMRRYRDVCDGNIIAQ